MWSFFQLMVWGLVWLLTWPAVTIYRKVFKKPRLDNCFTWAIRRWHDEENSYLVIRWARVNMISWLRWPHFMWLPADKSKDVRHFVPLEWDQNYRMFPKAFFEGKVVTGDNKEENLEN